MGDAEIFENLSKVINYSFSPQIHIHTKHLHATYLITVEIYYFTGMGYKDDNSGELCLLFYFMRMYTKHNGNAWKNWKSSNLLTKIGMNFSFIQKRILVKKLLSSGLSKKRKFWSGFREGNHHFICTQVSEIIFEARSAPSMRSLTAKKGWWICVSILRLPKHNTLSNTSYTGSRFSQIIYLALKFYEMLSLWILHFSRGAVFPEENSISCLYL